MNTELVDILLLFFKYFRQDDDGVKNVLSWVYNAIMQVEAEAQAGCATYERSDGRRLHRNGYRQRGLTTLYGDLVLKKPRFREEGFKTIVFEAYSRVEKAVLSLVGESYLQGVSTRKIEDVLQAYTVEPFLCLMSLKDGEIQVLYRLRKKPIGAGLIMEIIAKYSRCPLVKKYFVKGAFYSPVFFTRDLPHRSFNLL